MRIDAVPSSSAVQNRSAVQRGSAALFLSTAVLLGAAGCGDDGADLPPGSGFGMNNNPTIPTPLAPNVVSPSTGGTTPVTTAVNPVVPVSPQASTAVAPVTTLPPTTPDPTTTASAPVAPAVVPTAMPTGGAVTPPATTTPAEVAPTPTTDEVDPTTPDDPAPQGNPDEEPVLPQTDTGWFPANSNFHGFQGSWYCFDDGELETTCVTDEPPWVEGEGMCLTGSTIEDDTFTAWGGGIGVSLNDDDGTKLPFDAESAGITGFKFTITGDLGGATLKFMVPLTSKDSEEAPPEYAAKVGANSVTFDEVVRPDWADPDQEAANPAELYELKWQIAGGTVEAEYNFCVTNVEPL